MLTMLTYLYLAFVGLTSRIKVAATAEDSIVFLREKRVAVYTFWHESILFILYFFGSKHFPILITSQGKKNRLSALASWMGLRVFRGSIEGGGRHALNLMLDQLKSGHPVLLAADSPHSQARKCRASCFFLAQENSVPVIPLTWTATFRIRIPLKNGPIYLPLPFNSIQLKLGAPFAVARHYELSEMDFVKNQLESLLNKL